MRGAVSDMLTRRLERQAVLGDVHALARLLSRRRREKGARLPRRLGAEWIRPGYGNGDGYGYGDGYGNGNGDGYGYGDGYGDGYGNGYGHGAGNGYGYGYGYGDGYGSREFKGIL